jgi:hypothetical protein
MPIVVYHLQWAYDSLTLNVDASGTVTFHLI